MTDCETAIKLNDSSMTTANRIFFIVIGFTDFGDLAESKSVTKVGRYKFLQNPAIPLILL